MGGFKADLRRSGFCVIVRTLPILGQLVFLEMGRLIVCVLIAWTISPDGNAASWRIANIKIIIVTIVTKQVFVLSLDVVSRDSRRTSYVFC